MSKLIIKESVEPKILKYFLLSLSKQTQSTFNYFGIISNNTVNEIVKKELVREDKLKFFTFWENQLIGYGFLTLLEKPTKKHTCILGIVVGDNWQNKGYGKKICEKMVEKAWNHKLEKIWLTVHSDNIKAIKLYKSLGFKTEGIFMNDEFFNGKFRNIVSMALFKNKKFNMQDRLKIWKDVEGKSF